MSASGHSGPLVFYLQNINRHWTCKKYVRPLSVISTTIKRIRVRDVAQWYRNDPSSNPGRAVCLCYCLKSGSEAKPFYKQENVHVQ